MATHRMKPVDVDAFQMTGDAMNNNVAWPSWLHEAWNREPHEDWAVYPVTMKGRRNLELKIKTPGGDHLVCREDWIIRGNKGGLHVCDPALFDETFEPA